MIIKDEVGTGSESVYVYYYPSHVNGRSSWPCKIGRSGSDPESRIKQQQASMIEEPVIGLILWTENSRLYESAIHSALANSRLDSFGKEWYRTSPSRVKELFLNGITEDSIGGAIRLARHEAKLTQAELAERAGVRQATVSIIETGRNTTTSSVEAILLALGKSIVLVDL